MWDVIKYLTLFVTLFWESSCYIETVEQSGCESCMIMLTCRHLDSIIAVLEARFEPFENTTSDRPTVFPPIHPRLVLNQRCSGVNHCSFILNKDCPGADKWGAGNVTVKYVCISERRVNKYCNQNITLGSQVSSLEMAEGFIHNPGYPKFYLGHQDSCRWRIIGQPWQQVKITILDLSIIGPPHEEDDCKDILEIKESDQVLYSSCSQEQPPMEIVSSSNLLEVAFTSTETIIPTRGILFHYTAIGCHVPPIPHNSHLIRRSKERLEFHCCIGHVFADTKEKRKVLTCQGYKWDVPLPLPDCENSTNKEDNVYKIKTSKGIISTTMSDTQEAIVIPAIIIAILFLVNAVIVFYIYKRREAALNTITEEEMQVVNNPSLP